jgi:hypothetical protein
MEDIISPEEAFEKLEQLSRLRVTRIQVPKNPTFSRKDVVSAFATAFEMIGGVPRLALWANENPTDFYKLFGKLLPSATQAEVFHHKSDGTVKSMTTEELEQLLAESSNVYDMEDERIH